MKGKLDITGNGHFKNLKGVPEWVQPYDENHDRIICPSINVSAVKTPARIAADIKRRLLPDYQIFHAACLKRTAEANEYQSGVQKARADFERVTGQTIASHQSEQHFNLSLKRPGKDSVYCKIYAGGTSANLELSSLTHVEAIKVLEFLNGL